MIEVGEPIAVIDSLGGRLAGRSLVAGFDRLAEPLVRLVCVMDGVSCPSGAVERRRFTRARKNMLTLTRKPGQRILIGNGIRIELEEIQGRQARISIEAPVAMPVIREELYLMIAAENARAARTPDPAVLDELSNQLSRRPGIAVPASARAAAAPRRQLV